MNERIALIRPPDSLKLFCLSGQGLDRVLILDKQKRSCSGANRPCVAEIQLGDVGDPAPIPELSEGMQFCGKQPSDESHVKIFK